MCCSLTCVLFSHSLSLCIHDSFSSSFHNSFSSSYVHPCTPLILIKTSIPAPRTWRPSSNSANLGISHYDSLCHVSMVIGSKIASITMIDKGLAFSNIVVGGHNMEWSSRIWSGPIWNLLKLLVSNVLFYDLLAGSEIKILSTNFSVFSHFWISVWNPIWQFSENCLRNFVILVLQIMHMTIG